MLASDGPWRPTKACSKPAADIRLSRIVREAAPAGAHVRWILVILTTEPRYASPKLRRPQVNLLVRLLAEEEPALSQWSESGVDRIPFGELAGVVEKYDQAARLIRAIRADPLFAQLMADAFAVVERLDDWNARRGFAPVVGVDEHPAWTTLLFTGDGEHGVTLPQDRFSEAQISLFWETHDSLRRLSAGWGPDGGLVLAVAGGECGHYYRGACTGGTCNKCVEEWVEPPGGPGGWACRCDDEDS